MNKRQKQTEKFALRAIAIVMLWFILLWTLVSLAGCCDTPKTERIEDVYHPCPPPIDSIMDRIEMDCGE